MNIGQNWKLDKNENWTKKWKLDKIGQYWKRQMVKLENRSVEARCRCSRFKKSQFEKTRQINVVLYWLAYDSFHLTNFLWNLQLWRFLACKQPNPYHCWQKCVSMHIFGHHWKTTRICLLWHDLWLERRLQSHLQRWCLRHGLHADQQSKILPEKKVDE